MSNETLRILQQRRSIRKYKVEQIKEEELQAVLNAGLTAPYAMAGSRHFAVVQNKELIDRLSRKAKEAAVQMGMPGLMELGQNKDFHCLYNAPTAIIVSGNEQTPGPEYDCAAATQNILIAAEALGLGACWVFYTLITFFTPDGEALKKELQIPDGYKPFTSIALGYKDETVSGVSPEKADAIIRIR